MQLSNSQSELERNRNKVLAKSFYRHLRTEGLTSEQIIALSAELIDLVTEEIKETPRPAQPRTSRA